ncbi:MAG: outer membrane protein assembly factor BamB [Acidiferrobacterales bacterium]|nr:outer membrane protein assembly factor BamB [Acidiferrobacterales bacterium]
MNLKIVFLSLLVALVLTGCNKNKETKWGTFNEPVPSQPMPEASGEVEFSTLWKQKIGDAGEDGYAILRPGISNEGVLVVNRKGLVRLLDSESGKVQWSKALGKPTYSGVGAGAGLAVVAFDNGTVVALDATDGTERWRNAVNRQISAIPAVGAGRVIIRTADGLLIGLNASNGENVWELTRSVPGLSLHGDSQPLISGDTVITGLSNGRILVSSVLSGREFWEKDLSIGVGANELEQITDVDATPTIDGLSLYTGTYQGEIVSLNLQDSSIQWQFDASSRLPLSVSGNQLVLTDDSGAVIHLDAQEGFLNWEQDGFRGRGVSNPLLIGDYVVIGDAEGSIHALNGLQGDLLQSKKVSRSAIIAIQQLSGGVLALSADGTITLLSFN